MGSPLPKFILPLMGLCSVALGEPEHGRLSTGPLPRGVYRTAYLPGPPTAALWEQVLGDARRTFRARGKASEGGGVREWRNSNLRVSLEPAGDGSRLHLQTRRDDRVLSTAILAVVALFALATFALSGFDVSAEGSVGVLTAAMAVGALSLGLDQRRWASERERQFAEVARRASEASRPAGTSGLDAAREAPAAGRIDPGVLEHDAPEGDAPEGDRGGGQRRRVR